MEKGNLKWVFFNSPAAVNHSWDILAPLELKVAALGKGTARELRKRGAKIDFIGSHPVKLAAQEFVERIGTDRVLFPVTAIGKRTVQQALSEEQLVEVEAYRTVDQQADLPHDVDIIAFTSPSNVHSFLKQHQLPSGVKVVAIGESTAATLQGVSNPVFIADGYGVLALFDRIMGLNP